MQAETSDVSFETGCVNWPMSKFSKWTKVHSNLSCIVERRRRNYAILTEQFSGSKAMRPLFPVLPSTVCPWIFPLVFPDSPNAHLPLRERGIPAVTWGGVRHPQVLKGQFGDSDFLYDNLVYLPIHQCLEKGDLMTMVRVVKECFNSESRDAISRDRETTPSKW